MLLLCRTEGLQLQQEGLRMLWLPCNKKRLQPQQKCLRMIEQLIGPQLQLGSTPASCGCQAAEADVQQQQGSAQHECRLV